MWWVVIAVILLGFSELVEVLRNRDPMFQKEKMEKHNLKMEERYELIVNLKENIGNVCTITSKELLYVNGKVSLTARILGVDEEWVNLEYVTKDFRRREVINHLAFKTDSIENFAVAVNNEGPK